MQGWPRPLLSCAWALECLEKRQFTLVGGEPRQVNQLIRARVLCLLQGRLGFYLQWLRRRTTGLEVY